MLGHISEQDAYKQWEIALAEAQEAFEIYLSSGISTITKNKERWEALVEKRSKAARVLAFASG
jgi:PleD family two-component response regulator